MTRIIIPPVIESQLLRKFLVQSPLSGIPSWALDSENQACSCPHVEAVRGNMAQTAAPAYSYRETQLRKVQARSEATRVTE